MSNMNPSGSTIIYEQQQQPQQQHQSKQYNSLLDPHLELYFRRPAVRRQLLAKNIITKDNKIVDEMRSTAYKQAVLLSEKRQAYETMCLNEAKQREHRKSILDRMDALLLQDSDSPHKTDSVNERHQITPPPQLSPQTTTVGASQHPTTVDTADWPAVNGVCNMLLRHQSAPNLVSSCERSSRPKSSYGRRTTAGRPITSTVGNVSGSIKKPTFVRSTEHHHKSSLKPTIRQPTNGMNRNISKSLHNLCRTTSSQSTASLHRLIAPKTPTSGTMEAKMTMKYQSRMKVTSLRRVTIAQQRMVGGTTVNIFDRYLRPGDEFTFNLREHSLGAFALVFMLDQIRDASLNACCEYKHRSGARFGHFLLVSISGGKPCLLCEERMHSRSIRFNLESIDRSEKASMTSSTASPSLAACSKERNVTVSPTVANVSSDFEVNTNDIQRRVNANQEEEYKHDNGSNGHSNSNSTAAANSGSKRRNGIRRHYDTATAGVLASNERVLKPNHQLQNDGDHLRLNSAAKVVNMRTTITESRLREHKGQDGGPSGTLPANNTSLKAHPVHNRSQPQFEHSSSETERNMEKAKVQLNDSIDDGDAQLHKHSSSLSSDSANDHESNVNSFENESLPSLMLEMSSSSEASK